MALRLHFWHSVTLSDWTDLLTFYLITLPCTLLLDTLGVYYFNKPSWFCLGPALKQALPL